MLIVPPKKRVPNEPFDLEGAVLEFLHQSAATGSTELCATLEWHYPDANEETLQDIGTRLEDMVSHNLIQIDRSMHRHLGMKNPDDGYRSILTLKSNNIRARLTTTGKKEVENRIFGKQVSQVNQSVIDTNKSTKFVNKLFWATLIIAALGAAASVRSCQLTRDDNDRELKKESKEATIKVLADSIQQINDVRSLQKRTIDSLQNVLSRDNKTTSANQDTAIRK